MIFGKNKTMKTNLRHYIFPRSKWVLHTHTHTFHFHTHTLTHSHTHTHTYKHTHTHFLYLSFSFYLSLSLILCLSLYLTPILLSLSLSFSISVLLFLFPSFYKNLAVSLSLSLSLSLCFDCWTFLPEGSKSEENRNRSITILSLGSSQKNTSFARAKYMGSNSEENYIFTIEVNKVQKDCWKNDYVSKSENL